MKLSVTEPNSLGTRHEMKVSSDTFLLLLKIRHCCRVTLTNVLSDQCCQMHDNYRICTIILPSVRCTINNANKC